MRLPGRRKRDEAESSLDLLVVGLGNPGREYEHNRHNAGRMVVDELARRHGAGFRSKFSGRLADLRLDDHRVALLAPETYMNESGSSVGGGRALLQGCRSSRCSSSTTRATSTSAGCRRGSAAGSPGTTGSARSPPQLGSQEFLRLRIGVGRPGRGDPRPLADYVLADFEPYDDADTLVARAADAVESLVARRPRARRSAASTDPHLTQTRHSSRAPIRCAVRRYASHRGEESGRPPGRPRGMAVGAMSARTGGRLQSPPWPGSASSARASSSSRPGRTSPARRRATPPNVTDRRGAAAHARELLPLRARRSRAAGTTTRRRSETFVPVARHVDDLPRRPARARGGRAPAASST